MGDRTPRTGDLVERSARRWRRKLAFRRFREEALRLLVLSLASPILAVGIFFFLISTVPLFPWVAFVGRRHAEPGDPLYIPLWLWWFWIISGSSLWGTILWRASNRLTGF